MPNARLRRVGRTLRRRWAPIAAGGVAVVLVGAGTSVAFAAQPTTASTTTTTHVCAPGVGKLLAALPDSLKADLKTLHDDTSAQKVAERAEIKKKALAGDYGAGIEQAAKIVAGDKGKLVSAIPAAMKADLTTLRGDAKGSAARTAEAATIWKKALAGSYGTTVESLAKDAHSKIEQHCSAAATS
jgi:hypothetical protein